MAAAICELLKEKIRAFLSSRNESIRWLARQTHVAYSTVYRLQGGEQQNLDFQNAQKLLGYIAPDEATSILSDFYPREMQGAKATASAEKNLETLSDNLALFRIFAYAEAHNSNRDTIQKKYGDDGVALLDRLLTMGVLVDTAQGYHSTIDAALFPREEIIKKISIHNYAMTSLDNPCTLMEAFRSGLTLNGMKDAFYTVEECRNRLSEIYLTEKGDNLFVVSLLAGPGELQ